MTMFGLTAGQRVSRKFAVSTSAVTLHTSSDKMSLIIESVAICNTNAASRTVSLYVDNGSTQFYVFNDLPLASKATVLLTDHPLNLTRGETLKAIASGAGIIVTASVVQSTPVQNDQRQSTLSTVSNGARVSTARG